MYLSRLNIKNFRCVESLSVDFQQGLNVIVGENNSGKTSILDALRICLNYSGIRRELYIRSDDFHIDKTGIRTNAIEFDLIFSGLSDTERGIFIEMLSLSGSEPQLQLHLRYFLENRNGIERIRPKKWGGDNERQDIPYEVLELFYFVFLGALRDAERDLSPSKGNRLSQLFLKLVQETDKQKEHARLLQNKIDEVPEWKSLLASGSEKVNEHLKQITIESDEHEIEIGFVPIEFRRVVENLKMQLPINSNNGESAFKFEIDQNGLGYNNLIYIATVLGDILERKKAEEDAYVALLIEEPEAHLHPQLQDILFNFVKGISDKGIQIFITSHSPTVTAKTPIDSIVVLQRSNRIISSTSLKACPLSTQDKHYLERFLDVTKAQLFFARGVILVEGISEALLFPCFAQALNIDLDKSGIEIVNIGGTAFEPFAHLFNSEDIVKRLSQRCAVVTDDDRDASGILSDRANKTRGLERGLLKVFMATKTLEYELFANSNVDLIKELYRQLHPRTEINTVDEFVLKLKNNNDKAIFAQLLALKLIQDATARNSFTVPDYIKNAINWVATSSS